MAEQEFLASFAVEIDESGVEQLQKALEKNRELADALSAAFDRARSSVQAFFHELSEISYSGIDFNPSARVTEEQQGISLPFSLDFTKAGKELAAFFKDAGKNLRLTADASGVVSAGRSALSELQALYGSTVLQLQAEILEPEAVGTGDAGNAGNSGKGGGGGSGGGIGGKPANSSFQTVMQAAVGGRFDEPTTTEIAEDGDPEYVIPVKKESLAVPLMRQLIGELSDSAQQTLRQAMPVEPEKKEQKAPPVQEKREPEQTDASPLLQQLVGELSDTAKQALQPRPAVGSEEEVLDAPEQFVPEKVQQEPVQDVFPQLRQLIGSLSDSAQQTHQAMPAQVIHEPEQTDASPLLQQLAWDLSDTAKQVLQPSAAEKAGEEKPGIPERILPEKESPVPDVSSLLRQLIGELSDSAKETMQIGFSGDKDESGMDALSGLPDLLASARGATTQIVNQQTSSNVSAPVSIQVTAAGSDPEAVGRSVYDVAEQYLLRTLQDVVG